MTRGFSVSFTAFLISADLLVSLLAVRLAEFIRTQWAQFDPPIQNSASATPLWFYGVFPLVWLFILNSAGAYSPRRTYRLLLEISVLLRATLIAIFIFFGILYITYPDYSHVQAVYLVGLIGSMTLAYRIGLRAYFRLTGGRTYDSRRILVVGVGELAQKISRQVRAYAWTGVFLAGYVHDSTSTSLPTLSDAPLLGGVNQITDILKQHEIDEVILALQQPDYNMLRQLVMQLNECGVSIRLAPDIQELEYLFSTVEDLNRMPLIGLREPLLTPAQRLIKRVMDVVLSALLIVVSLPIMVGIAIIIRLNSPGAPIFVQERIGEGMQPFKMYKFRTMVRDADKMQAQINATDENGRLVHKHPKDPRVTLIGHFLRQTSLDELPQLFNVLKGDMSLVGPRPEMPWIVELYEPWQKKRFEVPQGMTGWWQINGRSGTMMHLSTEDDLYYIQNYSIWLDIVILLRTLPAVFSMRGAF